MPRTRFAQYLLVGGLLLVKNSVQLAFLADSRRRARKLTAPHPWES